MRSTWSRIMILSMLLTLLAAGVAWAHVEVSPSQVSAGDTETFTVEVPTEKEMPTTGVRLELPQGFEAEGAEAPSGWRGEVRGDALVWSGGEIPVADSEEFTFEARVPDEAGTFALDAIQTYEDGSVVEWTGAPESEEPAPTVEVASGGGAAGETDEAQHGDERHGDGEHSSHSEDEMLSETGGPASAFFLAASALALMASATALVKVTRR